MQTPRRQAGSLKRSACYIAFEQGKLVLQTIQDLSRDKRAFKTVEIAEALREKAGDRLDLTALDDILAQGEEYGFIKKDAASHAKTPVLVWKT